jgi:hypothetical protein
MGLLAYVLRDANPFIVAVSDAFGHLLDKLQNSVVNSPRFGHFIDQFARLAGRDIRIGGHILGELAKGVGALLLATDKGFSGGFLRGLDHLSTSFADWASSKSARHDMREFFGYVHDVGPQVGHTLGAIAHAAGQLIKALAPLGPPVLRGIELAANAISAIPVPVLTGMAAAFTAAVLAAKAGKGINSLTTGLAGLGIGGKGGALGAILSGGIQKVYVVNMPGGGIGGGPGGDGPGGTFGKFGRFAPLAFAPEAATVAVPAAASIYALTHPLPETTPKLHAISKAISTRPGYQMPMGTGYVANSAPVTPAHLSLKSTTTAFDALRAHAQLASQTIDQIGPHAAQTFGAASKDVDSFAAKLAAIRDKRLSIILQDQAAIQSLEHLQAFRIHDKYFNVYQRNQLLEQAVVPGGGIGRHNPGGSGGGGGRTPVHIHLDDNGRTTLTGVIQDNYDANRNFERAHQ